MQPLVAGTSWDCLRAELDLLNACLLGQVQRRTQKNTQLDYLQGLVLSEHEVLEILTKPLDSVYEINTTIDPTQLMRETNDSAPQPGQLAQLRDLFQLERIEELCLLLCLAPEIDARYAKVFAFLQDDVTRKQPGVELALRLFCKDVHESLLKRRLFAPGSPLFRYRLINYAQPTDRQLPLLQRLLKIDDRIAAFVLQLPQLDDCLVNWVEIVPPSDEHPEVPLPRELVERTLRLVENSFSGTEPFLRPLVHLYGRSGSGRRELATLASHHIGLPLIIADIKKLANGEASEVEVLSRLCREALLLPAVLLIENFDELLHDGRRRELAALQEAAHYYASVTFLSGSRFWKPETPRHFYLSLECPVPDATSRVDFWRQHLHKKTEEFQDQDLIELSSKFSFTEGQIHQTVTTAQHRAYWESRSTQGLTPKLINEVARSVATPNLMGLARKIETPYSWADIVLPENQMRQLMEIVSHARRSQIIFETWGFARKFAYGRGITALFEGQSGTGKTMAASIIGHALELDVYQIDLSSVVSKYIGETEKNLSRIFEEAEDSNAVLFFDEADALFGKRSEVKDAHDRYANIETAYLLQRMEQYSGIVILATNMKQNLDEAFARRMRFIINFPFPNEDDRERVWQKAFPANAPLGLDVDFRWLSRKLKITGGNIKNISLRAAFLAIERQGVIDMECLIDAAKRENEKIGKIDLLADYRGPDTNRQALEVAEVA
jgi:ATP-dependent 26S proteasome regulatory subunit